MRLVAGPLGGMNCAAALVREADAENDALRPPPTGTQAAPL